MATFLFDKIIFGPVKSRRLGISLGINLLPTQKKVCNFNCVYCECGLNTKSNLVNEKLPAREDVFKALEKQLIAMQQNGEMPDVITFAGNGEPTLHPEFPGIIDDTIKLRNLYFPKSKISVLSNATMLHKHNIVNALKKVDQNIQKLDSGLENTINAVNQPVKFIPIDRLIEQLQQFEGKVIIQTLFTRGFIDKFKVDNTTNEDIIHWIECIKKINPEMVMIYTIERDTPYDGLTKISLNELKTIAKRVENIGIKTQVNG